jgi:lysophospholipase L1-like esterase
LQNIWKISAIVFAVLFGVIFFREHYPVRIYNRILISAPTPIFSPHDIEKNKIFGKYDYKNKIVFIGDSITERCEWLDRHGILNLGMGYDTTHGVLNRLDFTLNQKPKCIFIMIGINDINGNTSMNAIKTNYSKIIDKILKSHVQLFVLSTLRMNRNPHGVNFKETNKKVDILNNYLREQCKLLSVPFIDLNGQLSDHDKLLPKYSIDGLHLNDEGYVIWENILLPYINKIE